MLSRHLRSIFLAIFLAAVFTLPGSAFAQLQVNQFFNEQGPAPSSGPFCVVGTGDAPPKGVNCGVGPGQNPLLSGTVVGAVQAVAPDPIDPSTIYVGALNGGVWVTHNGGTSWTPLSDRQASLSITSLVLDPTDSTRRTLLAGTSLMSNGSLSSQHVAHHFWCRSKRACDRPFRQHVAHRPPGGRMETAMDDASRRHSVRGGPVRAALAKRIHRDQRDAGGIRSARVEL
jgi:hypothetical protein